MSDSASVTASSLAITENKPRRTGGCVGIFFQLFDWNRRFAKKKLFSKRLLPPDRAKEASKKFGGDEKLPKLRLIADENSGGFPNMNKNGVSTCNNGVQTPSLVARLMGLESMPSSVNRDKLHNHKAICNKEESEKETTRQDFRPQKLQKTMADRRCVTRFGAEALQLKNVLSRSKKHHRHHPKLASPVKTTTHHSRKNTSRLIGAASRILETRNKSKFAITYPHSVRTERMKLKSENLEASCKNCDAVSDNTKDFVALNRSLSGQTRSRAPNKVEDTKRNNIVSRGQKRHLTQGYGVMGSSNNKPRRVMSASCNGKQMKHEHQGQNGNGMMFKFSSPMKNTCEKVEKRRNQNQNVSYCKLRKRPTSNQIDKFPLTGDSLGALLEAKLNELTSQTSTKRTPAHIFQELLCALNKENPLPQNDVFCLQTNSEKSGYKNSNHLSPGSVLEASFSNDSCCSSSLEDSSGRMQHTDSTSYSYDESHFQKFQNSELVDTIAEIMWTKFGNFFGYGNAKTRYQVKRFVFDCLIEYLDSNCGVMGSKVLIDEVMEEVMRWMDFIGLNADEVAERDMSYCLVKLMDFEIECREIGGRIEGDLVNMLVDEIVYDFATI
ncbi:unnamed protein product [Lactuca virosa]|uniref:DUF3741 domain-containing protein n=1 Tax=Lactuca virosa TaxID=75947 RepID=A0AAU9M5C3_9ASTR|nr:unnamed protein product [Lactuca virosa]